MYRTSRLRALFAGLVALTLVACGGDGSSDPSAGGRDTGSDGSGSSSGSGSNIHAGMGSSTAQPTGQPYTFPDGVQVDQPVKGDDPFCIPDSQTDEPMLGSGGLVRLCLAFRNTKSMPITVVLPPGLIFVSDSIEQQNGIVLQRTEIVVPPGTVTYYVPVYLFCLNLGRHPTSGAQDTYHSGTVTDDADVLELLSLLRDKHLPLVESDGAVQNALWDITDRNGLTQDDRNAIAALH
jgi:hypothetical protein